MRKNEGFDPANPIIYNYDNSPNFKHLREGSRVILEMEWDGDICYRGYGTIASVKQNPISNFHSTRLRYSTKLRDYKDFPIPKMKDDELREVLRSVPQYNWTDDIRPIPKQVYERIMTKSLPSFIPGDQESNAFSRIDAIIAKEESEVLEFKATMWTPMGKDEIVIFLENRISRNTSVADRKLYTQLLEEYNSQLTEALKFSVVKTIGSFLNTRGGTLVMGVFRESGGKSVICGVDPDYARTKDWDGWRTSFTEVMRTYFGQSIDATNFDIRYDNKDGKRIARISVIPTKEPKSWLKVPLRNKDHDNIIELIRRQDPNLVKALRAKLAEKADEIRKLPVRSGARTDFLDGPEFQEYLARRQ